MSEHKKPVDFTSCAPHLIAIHFADENYTPTREQQKALCDEIWKRFNNHERLAELLAQCSTELAESIEGKYQGILGYPSTDRDYRTDMAIVEEARTLLAQLKAGKGGE